MRIPAICSMLIFLAAGVGAQQMGGQQPLSRQGEKQSLSQVHLSMDVEKSQYVLGEIVVAHIHLRNEGVAPAVLRGPFSVSAGQLKVFLAYQAEPFKEYRGPGWGLSDIAASEIHLDPGAEQTVSVTILHHRRLPSDHLSALYVRRYDQQEISDDYALYRSGSYRVKAVFFESSFASKIESDAVVFEVNDPAGDDARVWNTLKASSVLGYLLQTGEVPLGPDLQEDEAISQLRQLLRLYPTTTYAKQLGAGIRMYQARHRLEGKGDQ